MKKVLRVLLGAALAVALSHPPVTAANTLNPHPPGTPSGGIDPTAIVMDCNGDDTSPGTVASPVRTFARAHALMTGGNTRHTYLRGSCTYPVSTNIWQFSNETYEGYPADARTSAEVDISTSYVGCWSCSNLAIRNLKIVGSNVSGVMLVFSRTTSLSIEADWIIDQVNHALSVFNSDNVQIRGNKFDVGTTKPNNAISTPFNDNAVHAGLFITDNVFVNCVRFCIEAQNQTTAKISRVHIDRNVCDNCMTKIRGSFGYISAVTGPGAGNTVIGNFFGRATGTPCLAAVEVGMQNTTVTGNRIINACWAFWISSNAGSVFQGNSITFDLATTHAGFGRDGGYDATEWIGVNRYGVGSGYTDVGGCQGNKSPSFCTLDFNSDRTQPPMTPASSHYVYAE